MGRQGGASLPHGIAVLTVADYYSLGNRAHAFTAVAPTVAAIAPGLRAALREHLLASKVRERAGRVA